MVLLKKAPIEIHIEVIELVDLDKIRAPTIGFSATDASTFGGLSVTWYTTFRLNERLRLQSAFD